MDIPHVTLASSLNGSAGLPHINFTAFTRDEVDTGEFQAEFVLDWSK
jgi:hypothetical protein